MNPQSRPPEISEARAREILAGPKPSEMRELPTSAIHTTTVERVPKQTRPRMVPLSFRVPEAAKDAGYAKADREGRNPTEVMRELWVAWAEDES